MIMRLFFFFFFKQKTAYEMRISDWSSDVCSSDLLSRGSRQRDRRRQRGNHARPCGSAIVRRKEMNEMTRSWPAEAETLLDDLVALRRAIHREPELGLQNPKTLAKIKDALAGLPFEFREGPSTTGLIAVLRGPANGRTVLLRGDMDALPLIEDTGLDFTSETSGAMHACGHDSHVAVLRSEQRR